MTDLSQIKVLTFDVGGTVFDWRGTIEDEAPASLPNSRAPTWTCPSSPPTGAEACSPCLRVYRSRELPWMNADELHRRVLDDVLADHTALTLSESERDDLNEVWHRLRAWPDAPAAIERLRSRYTVVVSDRAELVDCRRLLQAQRH